LLEPRIPRRPGAIAGYLQAGDALMIVTQMGGCTEAGTVRVE
jgi:hypothetical protein